MSARADGRVKDRAEPGRHRAAPQASLRRSAGSPIIGRWGNGSRGRARVSGCRVRPMSGVIRCGQCRWLQSSLRVSRPWPGAWGGSASGRAARRGQSSWRPRCRWRRGRQISDLAPGRWPGKLVILVRLAVRRLAGRPGQAADLPVPQAVEDQGEQPPGGGHLGDAAGLLAAAVDDGLLGRADHRVAGDVLDGLDESPAQNGRALFGDVPADHLGVGFAVPRGQPGPGTQPGRRREPGGVADLGDDDRGVHRADAGQLPITW